MWATLLPWLPIVVTATAGIGEVLHEGLTGWSLTKALFLVLVGAVTKARGTTGGTVPLTAEAAVRLDKPIGALPGVVPEALLPGVKGDTGDRGPRGRSA